MPQRPSRVGDCLPTCTLFALLLCAAGADAQPVVLYRPVLLGTLGVRSYAYKINERGEVVGVFDGPVDDGGDHHAFVYRDGVMTELFPGVRGQAYDINDSGAIAGTDFDVRAGNAATLQAWVYDDGVRTAIPSVTAGGSQAAAINNNGDVVGYSWQQPYTPFAFNAATGRLGHLGLPDGSNYTALDINQRGDVVGFALTRTADEGVHPILYHDGAWSDLTGPHRGGWATAVNDAGDVAGYVFPTDRSSHAFLYRDGAMTLIGPAGNNSAAFDINARGTVVGQYNGPGSANRAFVSDGTSLFDLTSLLVPDSGWTLLRADGINDRDEIVGFGVFNGDARAFLLVPVPEPGTMVGGIAITALLLLRRNRLTPVGPNMHAM
jgi:probable HAF family extracellular repeat protein